MRNQFPRIVGRVSKFALPAFLFGSLLTGCDLEELLRPGMRLLPKKDVVNTAAEPQGGMSSAERAAFHRWLVTEMEQQIFARPLKDKAEANGWANVLSQRGSIEGVYHGFVLSTEYVNLEQQKKPADVKALRFYANEMAMLDFPWAPETDEKVRAAAEKYVNDSMSKSIFTLKQELGERILREADKRKGDAEKLAAWYSGMAARWAKLDIPFGLPQRNDKNEAFHFEWAKENTLGMIEWELLNREHRILNKLGGIALPEPPPAPAPAPAAPAKPAAPVKTGTF